MREIIPSLEFDTVKVEGDKYVDKGICALQISHFRIPVGTINIFREKDLKFDIIWVWFRS